MSTIVRAATVQDLPQMLAIYNDAVLHTTATYDYEPRPPEKQLEWFATKQQAGYPVLVADAGGQVAGFASYGAFRAWAGYRFTVEHSVYVRPDCRRAGLGRSLLEALVQQASAQGYHVMVGGIDAANAASVALHESLGFERCGVLRQVGWKFDRWLDLLFMQRILARDAAARDAAARAR